MKTSALTVLVLILAFFGIADSWYLAQSAYTGTPLTCDIYGFSDCNIVAQSEYSNLMGVPLALYGVFYFAFIFMLAAFALLMPRAMVYLGLCILGTLGLIASFVFVGIQVFLIKALCIYCIASALICVALFVCTYILWKRVQSPSLPGGFSPVPSVLS